MPRTDTGLQVVDPEGARPPGPRNLVLSVVGWYLLGTSTVMLGLFLLVVFPHLESMQHSLQETFGSTLQLPVGAGSPLARGIGFAGLVAAEAALGWVAWRRKRPMLLVAAGAAATFCAGCISVVFAANLAVILADAFGILGSLGAAPGTAPGPELTVGPAVIGLLATSFYLWMLLDLLSRFPEHDIKPSLAWLVGLLACWPLAFVYYFVVYRAQRAGRRRLS